MRVLGLLGLAITASAIELTEDDWDKHTAGKSVFIKFLAPWWGHCKKMKPAWDTLIDEYKDSTTSLVADVDCTAGGKSLCEKHGVQGYPTIKYGDPSDLQDYEGGRELADFQEFASENLGPSCGPDNPDLCSEKEKTLMDKYMAKMSYDLEELIEKKEKLMSNAEKKFEQEKAKLQRQISDAEKEKDKKIKKIKKTGLSMMRKVKAHKEKLDPDNKEDL